MALKKRFKMFEATRLKFEELYNDIYAYIKDTYDTDGEEMNTASPFIQILTVLSHLGRMILFYIESAITEGNILTAVHRRSIRGLSTLTGHNPSRGIAARGGVNLLYNRTTEHMGDTIYIKNYSKIRNKFNGYEYMIVLPSDALGYTVGASESNVEVSIIQGTLTHQQATGTGLGMQSFNFSGGNYDIIDDFYVNVYVNGEKWRTTQSFIDMSYMEKACVVKTSVNSGLDVFFGNGSNGAVPQSGAIIVVEYLVCCGQSGNLKYGESDMDDWEFIDSAWMKDGSAVDLNDIFVIKMSTDLMFGASGEDISVTRALAPHTSRAFVLANQTNYEYFLRRLNMFSTIEAIQGFNSYEDGQTKILYDIAEREYVEAREAYYAQVNLTGKNSSDAIAKYEIYTQKRNALEMAKNNLDNSKLDDNVVYLLLIPKLENRMKETNNYFTCNIDAFKLTDTEKQSILDLLDNSGQKLLTVDNRIIDPKMPKFAINIFIQMFDNFEFDAVKSAIIDKVSDYLLRNTRRDRIPVSDLVREIESVDGVDSVNVYFDADKNNSVYYGEGNYGIDKFGDIVLTREVTDVLGNRIEMRDMYPLFRGNFTSSTGIEYVDDVTSLNSTISVTLRGKTSTTMANKITMIK